MKKTYIVKGDHWQENFNSYAVFNELSCSDLAALSTCLAASLGSGWVKAINLSEWGQNHEITHLELQYGSGGDFSMELKKSDGDLIIDFNGELFRLPLNQFMKVLAAWEQIVIERPVVIELSESDGGYAFMTSTGDHLLVK